ncbi:hypothetical protein EH243_07880 [Amphritea opalescens]|uniref:Uncharacterized protein n=1 Tax=Amphritea opalescens TaxID=2490544 RepID=A0A430KSK3_9GAMM|nr:hypothetical protein [Amphritea opalescens]RTE66505.1 hypothetical protein EH243_07880 [Amphritea opalescens]
METKKNVDHVVDDDIEYDETQRDNPIEDPLAAIKNMRLEQLAVCRLKSMEEMQAMTGEPIDSKSKRSGE